jgi:hypothetical protein
VENDKFVKVCGTMVKLMELQQKAQETMREIVFAVAREHLKQNEVKQTVSEWENTKSCLKLWTGMKTVYAPTDGRLFLSKRLWPTHMRIKDLKPVRVELGKGNFEGMYRVYEPPFKWFADVMPDTLERLYVCISKQENNDEAA